MQIILDDAGVEKQDQGWFYFYFFVSPDNCLCVLKHLTGISKVKCAIFTSEEGWSCEKHKCSFFQTFILSFLDIRKQQELSTNIKELMYDSQTYWFNSHQKAEKSEFAVNWSHSFQLREGSKN